MTQDKVLFSFWSSNRRKEDVSFPISWSKTIFTFIPRGTKKNIKLATFKFRMPEKGRKRNEQWVITYCTKSVCPRTEMGYSSKKFSWCPFLLYRKRCGITFPNLQEEKLKKALEHKKRNKRHKEYCCQILQVIGLTV